MRVSNLTVDRTNIDQLSKICNTVTSLSIAQANMDLNGRLCYDGLCKCGWEEHVL